MKTLSIRLELLKVSRRPGWVAFAILFFFLMKGFVFLAIRLNAFGQVQNGYAFLAISATYSLFMIYFLLSVAAAASLSNEYAHGILRMHLARPLSRYTYFLNRSLFLTSLAFLLLVADAFAGTLIAGIGFGFSDVADPALQGEQFSSQAMAWASFKGYLLTYLGIVAITTMGLMVSVLFKTPTTCIGVAAGSFFAMEGIRLLFREPFASYVVTRYAYVHMEHLSKLARGIAEYQAPDYLVKAVVIPLAFYLLFTAIGLIVFRRMDILK